MTAFSLTRALLLAVLATAGVHGNPIAQVGGEKCGDVVCEVGLSCCNPSCGLCVKPGMGCGGVVCTTKSSAPATTPTPTPTSSADDETTTATTTTQCGPARCKEGTECCNESCGICVEPGHACTERLCLPVGDVCGDKVCAEGLVCCNASCGICAPPDGSCTMQICSD
ncbi:hypothetical protein VTH06DRAFT_2385 [Thermothelomyces fergusii]